MNANGSAQMTLVKDDEQKEFDPLDTLGIRTEDFAEIGEVCAVNVYATDDRARRRAFVCQVDAEVLKEGLPGLCKIVGPGRWVVELVDGENKRGSVRITEKIEGRKWDSIKTDHPYVIYHPDQEEPPKVKKDTEPAQLDDEQLMAELQRRGLTVTRVNAPQPVQQPGQSLGFMELHQLMQAQQAQQMQQTVMMMKLFSEMGSRSSGMDPALFELMRESMRRPSLFEQVAPIAMQMGPDLMDMFTEIKTAKESGDLIGGLIDFGIEFGGAWLESKGFKKPDQLEDETDDMGDQ